MLCSPPMFLLHHFTDPHILHVSSEERVHKFDGDNTDGLLSNVYILPLPVHHVHTHQTDRYMTNPGYFIMFRRMVPTDRIFFTMYIWILSLHIPPKIYRSDTVPPAFFFWHVNGNLSITTIKSSPPITNTKVHISSIYMCVYIYIFQLMITSLQTFNCCSQNSISISRSHQQQIMQMVVTNGILDHFNQSFPYTLSYYVSKIFINQITVSWGSVYCSSEPLVIFTLLKKCNSCFLCSWKIRKTHNLKK